MPKAPPKKEDHELELLDLRLHPCKNNGKPALELRKVVSLCDKNAAFFQRIIEASFFNEETTITARVSIKFTDRLKAYKKLKEFGFEFARKPKFF